MDCNDCGACCKWVIMPSPKPEMGWKDGRNIQYIDGFMLIPSRCKHLTEDNKCGIQENKPLCCARFPKNGIICKLCQKAEFKK